MKTSKKLAKLFSDSGLLSGISLSSLVFLSLSANPGFAEEPVKSRSVNPANLSLNLAAANPSKEEKNVELIVKYLSGGTIVVTDPKGEIIARSPNDMKPQGPLMELRNVSFATVTETTNEPDPRDPKLGLLDFLISPANAATVKYEYHITKIDGDVVSCRKHRVTPLPHAFVGYC
jgi:hypothetical protein